MAVTILEAVFIDDVTVRVRCSSGLTDPTFYIWINGELALLAYNNQLDDAGNDISETFLSLDYGDSLVLDIFDDEAASPAEILPNRMDISFRGNTAAAHYKIEEFVASVWTLRKKINETGAGYYNWTSRVLEDVTTHQFRVTPVGPDDNEGTAQTISVFMVRNPDPLDLKLSSYNDTTNKMTIDLV